MLLAATLVAATACAGADAEGPAESNNVDVVAVQPSVAMPAVGASAAMIDADGQLAFAVDGAISDLYGDSFSRPSGDGTTAVLTAHTGTATTRVTWVSLPDGEEQRVLDIPAFDGEVAAVSLDGEFAAVVNRRGDPVEGTIAGARSTTTIVVASRTDGVVYKTSFDGNLEPEAFGRRMGSNGLPAQIFLIDYLPAESPRSYRVRVLSTETGELSLPVNLRDKTQLVDQEMAGYTRSQVVSADDGLLFTLYIGTDDMPDGHPHAFVHTLDLSDGVWCLQIDPRLELEHLAGTLAVGGGRVYVASSNGWIGSYPIPSITDPELSPDMDWVVNVQASGDSAPAARADADGVSVAYGNQLLRLDQSGRIQSTTELPGPVTAISAEGDMIGPDWSTLGEVDRPPWLGDIVHLYPAN